MKPTKRIEFDDFVGRFNAFVWIDTKKPADSGSWAGFAAWECDLKRSFGAGEGNRTLVICLGSKSPTIKRHPRGGGVYFRISPMQRYLIST